MSGHEKGPMGEGHELKLRVAPKRTAVTRKIDGLWPRPGAS